MGATGDSSLNPPSTSKPLQQLRSDFLCTSRIPAAKNRGGGTARRLGWAFPLCPRADFGPEQGQFLPQLQDLGLNIPATLGYSRWPRVHILPTLPVDSTKTRTPTIRIHAEEMSVSLGGWDGATSSLPLSRSLVGDME